MMMRNIHDHKLLRTFRQSKAAVGMALSAGGLLMSGPVMAEPQGRVSAILEEIIVNATKKAAGQALQDAPVSVTGLSSDALELMKVVDIRDITYISPNTSLAEVGSFRGISNYSIRGMNTNSSVPSNEPAVGAFIDGVYQANNYGVMTDLMDVESIEVLRGPQGVLFGKNVSGGAVLIRSARPTDEFEGKIKTRFETGLDQAYTGVVSGAISDTVSGRLALRYRDDDGWFDNKLPGERDHGKMRTKIVRPSLAFQPGEGQEHTLILEYGEMEGDGPTSKGASIPSGDIETIQAVAGITDLEWTRATLESIWDVSFGDGTITNILGWRDIEYLSTSDIFGESVQEPIASAFGLPVGFTFVAGNYVEQEQLSNEFRYNGIFGKTDLTTGFFVFQHDAETVFNAAGAQTGARLDHQSWGIFTQVDYQLTDNLILTAGMRYSAEDKEVDQAAGDFIDPNTGVRSCTFNTTTLERFCTAYMTDDEDWDYITPKVGFSWDIDEDMLVYGSYSEGIRSGGYNLRIGTAPVDGSGNQIVTPPADEETNHSLEFGFKGTFNDGATVLNAAIFYNEVEDLLKEITVDLSQFLLNIGEAEVKGVEVELSQQLLDSLTLRATAGYTDAEYTDFTDEALAQGFTKELELTRTPEFTSSVSLLHEVDVAEGSLVSLLSYGHHDAHFTSDLNSLPAPSVDRIDLSTTYYSADNRWSVSLYGRNLTNQEVWAYSSSNFGGVFRGAFQGEGRTYGVELQYNL